MRGGPINHGEPPQLQYRFQSIPKLQYTRNQATGKILNAVKSGFSSAIKLVIMIIEEIVRTVIKLAKNEHKCDEWTHIYRESYMVEMSDKEKFHGILKSIITIMTSKHVEQHLFPQASYCQQLIAFTKS